MGRMGIVGNDFSAVQAAAQRQEELRQQASQFAFSQLMNALQNSASRNQRSDEFGKSLEFSREQAADNKEYRDKALEVGRENALANAMSRISAQEAKVNQDAMKGFIEVQDGKAQTTGEYDRDKLITAGASPLTIATLDQKAEEARPGLSALYDRKNQAVKVANQIARMEAVADGISTNKKENSGQGMNLIARMFKYGQTDPNAADPQKIAADLRAQAVKLKTQHAELLKDPDLVQVADGHYTIPYEPGTWYKTMRQGKITPRFGSNVSFAPPVRSAAPPVAPAEPIPAGVTRTNTPAINMPAIAVPPQTNVVTIQLPDGRLIAGPATNAAIILQNFPGASVVQ